MTPAHPLVTLITLNRPYTLVQSCPATTRLVITLIGCNAVGRASRFFRPLGFFFFLSCIYFLTANCFIFYVLCHDVLLPLCLLYIYSYLFYCFLSENSSLELMFMFIQPTLSFLYALLVSRVGKYDSIVELFGFILASYRAEAHLFGTSILITL